MKTIKPKTKEERERAMARRILPLLKRAAAYQTKAWTLSDRIADIVATKLDFDPGSIQGIQDKVGDLLSAAHMSEVAAITAKEALAVVRCEPMLPPTHSIAWALREAKLSEDRRRIVREELKAAVPQLDTDDEISGTDAVDALVSLYSRMGGRNA